MGEIDKAIDLIMRNQELGVYDNNAGAGAPAPAAAGNNVLRLGQQPAPGNGGVLKLNNPKDSTEELRLLNLAIKESQKQQQNKAAAAASQPRFRKQKSIKKSE